METPEVSRVNISASELPHLEKVLSALDRDIQAISESTPKDPQVERDIAPLKERASSLREKIQTLKELKQIENALERTKGNLESIRSLRSAASSPNAEEAIQDLVNGATDKELGAWQELGLIRPPSPGRQRDYPYPNAILNLYTQGEQNIDALEHRKREIESAAASTAAKVEEFRPVLRRSNSAPRLVTAERVEDAWRDVRVKLPERPRSLPMPLQIKALQLPSKQFIATLTKIKTAAQEELEMVTKGIARTEATVELLREFEDAFEGKDVRGMKLEIIRIVDSAEPEKQEALVALGLGKQRDRYGTIGYPAVWGLDQSYKQAVRDFEALQVRKKRLEGTIAGASRTLASFESESPIKRSLLNRVGQRARALFESLLPKAKGTLSAVRVTLFRPSSQAD